MKLLKVGLLATLIAGSFFVLSNPSARAERFLVNTVPTPGYYVSRDWRYRPYWHHEYRRLYGDNDYWRWRRFHAYRRWGGWY